MEDLVALRPTTIPFVPRILNRIYDKITGAVTAAGGSKKSMFDRAIKAKTTNMRNGERGERVCVGCVCKVCGVCVWLGWVGGVGRELDG